MIKKEEIEVKEFIKPALVNTVSAVKETQESIKGYATIYLYCQVVKSIKIVINDEVAHLFSNIDFDVATIT